MGRPRRKMVIPPRDGFEMFTSSALGSPPTEPHHIALRNIELSNGTSLATQTSTQLGGSQVNIEIDQLPNPRQPSAGDIRFLRAVREQASFMPDNDDYSQHFLNTVYRSTEEWTTLESQDTLELVRWFENQRNDYFSDHRASISPLVKSYGILNAGDALKDIRARSFNLQWVNPLVIGRRGKEKAQETN
ncbi:hypothetical protein FRC02_004814 [Tulasnella sp. 418]|nr:hypothetical protein FRC02_004814 [Tulasnella sp. 418]